MQSLILLQAASLPLDRCWSCPSPPLLVLGTAFPQQVLLIRCLLPALCCGADDCSEGSGLQDKSPILRWCLNDTFLVLSCSGCKIKPGEGCFRDGCSI